MLLRYRHMPAERGVKKNPQKPFELSPVTGVMVVDYHVVALPDGAGDVGEVLQSHLPGGAVGVQVSGAVNDQTPFVGICRENSDGKSE